MKNKLIAVFLLFTLCGCATAHPRADGSLADGTFSQEIGKMRQPQFQPDCPVR